MRKEEIKVVISCVAGKDPSAGHMRTENGRKVMFVADPEKAPRDGLIIYKRPDDPADSERSWRELLVRYNDEHKDSASGNPLGLLPAWKLYVNSVYRELVSAFGIRNVFILSAGWGLIPADYLTPTYDITFSPQADEYKRRRKRDRYEDLSMLPKDTRETVVFLGGKDYVPLFCRLTENLGSEKVVFYNSKVPPDARGCVLRPFPTKARTNWHYVCARDLAQGNISIDRL